MISVEEKAKAWDIIYPHLYHICDIVSRDKNSLYPSERREHIKYIDAIALALVIGGENENLYKKI